MTLIIKKMGLAIARALTPIPTLAPVVAEPPGQPKTLKEYTSPFKDSAHAESPPKGFAPAPRTIVKLTGGKPVLPRKPEPSQVKSDASDLTLAGLGEPEPAEPRGYAKWPAVSVGERVRITNFMFPWVKHYKPGDEAVIEMLAPHHNIAYDDPVAYRCHIMRIVTKGPTEGNRVTLFRHEFVPASKGPTQPTPGKIISMH